MNILRQIPRKIEQVKSPLQEVGRQLAKIGSSGSFATRLTVAAGDLHLEVQGVGRIRFPITPSTARRLCAVARPAGMASRMRRAWTNGCATRGKLPRAGSQSTSPGG